MQEVTLKPPQHLRDESAKRMSFDIAKRAPIPPERLAELEKQVKLTLEDARQNTAVMRRRLNDCNDVLEGVVKEVDYPFPNASNVDTKMAIGTARTFRSTLSRALFADPDRTFVASIPQESARGDANKVEDAFNWQAAHENGLIDALKDAILPIFRDGTAFLQGVWERRVERVIDYKTYVTAEEFMADYPPEDIAGHGIDDAKYDGLIRHLSEPDNILDVCFERDLVVKDGAAFSLVSLARFFWWPLTARSMDECELYGVRMEESEATMRRKKKGKEYRGEVVDACLQAVKEGTVNDQWGRSRDYIEGISAQADTSRRKDFENYRLVLTIDLDDDEVPEKYMGVFNLAQGRFLNFDRYKIRNNIDFLVPMRFDRRDDRLLGKSLLYDGMDIFQEITDIHRHRNNARMITDSPGFVAEDGLKDRIEGTLIEWHPGSVLWVPDGKLNAVKQFAMENRSNTGNSVDEENMLRGYVEFVIGPTQGLSGQETKGDASAPATKHLSKIRQAGYRLDDYIDEFKRSFPAVGKLALALYYQYGPMKVAYQSKNDDGLNRSAEAERSLFGLEGLTLDLNARSVIMSPEFEMERVMALRQEAAQNPIVLQTRPDILGRLWDRFVTASRTQNPEELKLGSPAPGMTVGAPPVPGAPTPTAGGSMGSARPALMSLVESLGMGNPTERPRREA